jgi:hypothetical protein
MTETDIAVYDAAVAAGVTDPRGLKALRQAAIELALEGGASVSQAVFSGAYAASCHRQFLAKAGSSPADRRPFFDAQTIGDPLIAAAWIVLGEQGGLAVERWVIDRSRWPLIVARAEPIYDSEVVADDAPDIAAEALSTVTIELALEAKATLAQAITAGNYAVHVHAAVPVGRLQFQAQILGDRLAVAALAEAGPNAYYDAERWVTAERKRIDAEAAILRQAQMINNQAVYRGADK